MFGEILSRFINPKNYTFSLLNIFAQEEQNKTYKNYFVLTKDNF
jgi:hypothetical protein